jgi:hypothetical protein
VEVAWRTRLSRVLLAALVLQPGAAPPVAPLTAGDARATCAASRPVVPLGRPALTERVAPDGSLAGYTLAVPGATAPLTRSLPPESFVSGPFRTVILVGHDDGRRSRVEAIDLATGCVTSALERPEVIRHAVASADGTLTWFAVDRRTRADLGVWRSRPGRDPEALLPALDAGPPPAAFGRTFTTELALTPTGGLVVSSCGIRACRYRVVDPGTGTRRRLDRPGLGALIVATDTALVTWAACGGVPCAVVRTSLRDGSRSIVARVATDARPAGPARIRVAARASDGIRWRTVDLSGERA